jgi:hypothetical protein
VNGLALDASDLAHHLLLDYAAKALIVVVALIVLAVGMTVIWRRTGHGANDAGRRDTGHRGPGPMTVREESRKGGAGHREP